MYSCILACCVSLLLLVSHAHAGFDPGLATAGYSLVISSGTCPAGYAADTSVQGFYLVGKTSAGTVGGSLGTAMTGATLPDLTYTPAATNGACGLTGSTTGANFNACTVSPTITGTADTTHRSTTSPAIQIVLCKRS